MSAAEAARVALARALVGKPAPRPTHAEERQLRRYFSEGADFFSAPSTFGRQLEQAELYSRVSKPCRACGGHDAYQSGDEFVFEKGGSGFITSTREVKQKRMMASILGIEVDLPGDVTCPRCGGRGWVTRPRPHKRAPGDLLTAQPTGSSIVGSDVDPGGSIEQLEAFGAVDRWLFRVHRRDALLWRVCAAYYAPAGSEAAIWVLTATGRAMFDARSDKRVNEAEFFSTERDLHHRQPDPTRAEAIEQMVAQSRALLEAAWAMLVTLR